MEKPPNGFDLTLCCPEAQCDGVPCPSLGRSCEICERAMGWSGDEDAPLTLIRPVGDD